MAGLQRIRDEYSHVQDNMPDGCSVLARRGNIENWVISIYGPRNTPYEGGCFNIECTFPPEYPNKPPTCLMRENNILHINIHPNGTIRGSRVLDGQWNPRIRMAAVIEYIRCLIAYPNPNCSKFQRDLCELYLNNHREYLQIVTRHTRDHALC